MEKTLKSRYTDMNFQKRLLEIVTPILFLPPRKDLLRRKAGYSTRETFFLLLTHHFSARQHLHNKCCSNARRVSKQDGTSRWAFGGKTAFICAR